MHVQVAALAALFLMGLAASAQAEGLKIKDGMWETTMSSPMTGERTNRECIKDAELDPETLLQSGDNCRLTEQNLEGNTLTFTMVCAADSGTAKGRMFVDGDHGNGEITMQIDSGGRQVDMTMTWDAVRIGDC
jgi:hypothetical protein